MSDLIAYQMLTGAIIVGRIVSSSDTEVILKNPRELVIRQVGQEVQMGYENPLRPFPIAVGDTVVYHKTAILSYFQIGHSADLLRKAYEQATSNILQPIKPLLSI